MKKISAIGFGILCLLQSLHSLGQSVKVSSIIPVQVDVTYNKTTNLIFPCAIKGNTDLGSKDIIAQKVKGIENILQLKAAKMDFPETNITVVTADGSFYSFNVDYADTPLQLNYRFNTKYEAATPAALFSSEKSNEVTIQANAIKVATLGKSARGLKASNAGIKMKLSAIYVQNEVFYLKFILSNKTNIDYDIDGFKLFIEDQKRIKRTAEQELDQEPLFIQGDMSSIPAQTKNTVVVALPKFTIPDKKYLSIQLTEKHGGRYLSVKVKNKKIVKARTLMAN